MTAKQQPERDINRKVADTMEGSGTKTKQKGAIESGTASTAVESRRAEATVLFSRRTF